MSSKLMRCLQSQHPYQNARYSCYVRGKAMETAWAPITHVGDMDAIPDSRLCPASNWEAKLPQIFLLVSPTLLCCL